jgi:DNA-binding response OmpR family regulator
MIARKAVLVVEDEPITALDLDSTLTGAGYRVLGPYDRLSSALTAAQTDDISTAVLDLALLNGMVSFPVAYTLRARGIPFLWLTGNSEFRIRERRPELLRDASVLLKPVQPEWLLAAIARMIRLAQNVECPRAS